MHDDYLKGTELPREEDKAAAREKTRVEGLRASLAK
jgi:hypothetical protein